MRVTPKQLRKIIIEEVEKLRTPMLPNTPVTKRFECSSCHHEFDAKDNETYPEKCPKCGKTERGAFDPVDTYKTEGAIEGGPPLRPEVPAQHEVEYECLDCGEIVTVLDGEWPTVCVSDNPHCQGRPKSPKDFMLVDPDENPMY